MNRRLLVISSIAAAGVVAACDEKTSDLSDTVRPNAYGFQMVPQATNLPRGSARFRVTGAPESVTVTLRGLDSLGAGFWVPWVGDSLGTSWKQVTGNLVVIRQDTTLNSLGQPDTTVTTVPVGSVSAIKNGGANQGWTWEFARATALGGGPLLVSDSMAHFLITMEDVANPATPGSRRFLWARRSDVAPVSGARTPALRFGNYGTTTLNEYLYSSTPARGRGYFQRQVFSVNDSTLARPPLGFYYAIWVLGELYKTSDTLFAGDLRSPYPRRNLSLYDADSIITDPEVVLDVPRQISAGALRISGDTLGFPATFPYQGYALVRLTLEAKAGIRGRMGPTRILQAPVPFLIFTGGLQ